MISEELTNSILDTIKATIDNTEYQPICLLLDSDNNIRLLNLDNISTKLDTPSSAMINATINTIALQTHCINIAIIFEDTYDTMPVIVYITIDNSLNKQVLLLDKESFNIMSIDPETEEYYFSFTDGLFNSDLIIAVQYHENHLINEPSPNSVHVPGNRTLN